MKFSDLIIVLVVTIASWVAGRSKLYLGNANHKEQHTNKKHNNGKTDVQKTLDVGGLSSKGASYDGPKINWWFWFEIWSIVELNKNKIYATEKLKYV